MIPSEHRPENYPVLSHTLVQARPERIVGFRDLYRAMARARRQGAGEPEQRALVEQLDVWRLADHHAEMRDLIVPSTADRREILAGLERALTTLEEVNDGEFMGLEHAEIKGRLLRAKSSRLELPASSLRRLRESMQRHDRLEELNGPIVILLNECALAARHLEDWRTPPAVTRPTISWDHGCESLLFQGLRLCVTCTPDGRTIELGIGPSRAVEHILAIEPSYLSDVLDTWEGRDGPPLERRIHAIGTYPLVPTNRVHDEGPAFEDVRDHAEGIGPLGWSVGSDVSHLAAAFEMLAQQHEAQGEELRAVAQRLAGVSAVVGCLELMTYEGDGDRTWLVRT